MTWYRYNNCYSVYSLPIPPQIQGWYKKQDDMQTPQRQDLGAQPFLKEWINHSDMIKAMIMPTTGARKIKANGFYTQAPGSRS